MLFASIVLYPNPASYQLVTEEGDLDFQNIKMLNQLSDDVTHYIKMVQSNSTRMVIDISELPKQTYILKG